jgi:tetratricopeptide (TPR) repeat protein
MSLSAFVGRSFADEDKRLWQDFREILEGFKPLGFDFEDASATEPRSVSEKVRVRIDRNPVYIGILSRRRPVVPDPTRQTGWQRAEAAFKPQAPSQWTSSEWIVEEVGFAMGRDKVVLLLIEDGVVFPKSDLGADTEYISFARDNLQSAQRKLTQFFSSFIGERLPKPVSGPVVPAPTDPPPSEPEKTSKEQTSFWAVVELAEDGKIEEADKLEDEYVAEVEIPGHDKDNYRAFIRYFRAKAGDASSLAWLKKHSSGDAPNAEACDWLAALYQNLGQIEDAIRVLLDGLKKVAPEHRSLLLLNLARQYRLAKEFTKCLAVLRKRLALDKEAEEKVESFLEVADYAKATSQDDLQISALEAAVQLTPLDTSRRFKLAYLYAEKKRPRLAIFHYRVNRSQNKDDVTSINNLAVAYGEIGLPDAEVRNYQSILDKHDLAKANLANIYVRAGFLDAGRKLARETVGSESSVAVDRANAAISEASEMEDKSTKEVEGLEEKTQTERRFRAQYADAFSREIIQAASEIECVFPWGRMNVTRTGNRIVGQATEQVKEHLGLLRNAMAGLGESPRLVNRTNKFEAVLDGCSGTFSFEIGGQTLISSKVHKGLIIVEPDLSKLSLLEMLDDDDSKIHEVRASVVPAEKPQVS